MSLPPPVARKHLHTRTIDMRGYEREDGLYDIEGHLVDAKTYKFFSRDKGRDREPGEHIHNMWLRLTVDLDFVVHDVEAATDASPFATCGAVTPNFKRLIGLKIGAGWRKDALARVGGVQGCTHLVEMLWPLATVAFQTMVSARMKRDAERPDKSAVKSKPFLLDTCYSFRSDGEIARTRWPAHYTGVKAAAKTGED